MRPFFVHRFELLLVYLKSVFEKRNGYQATCLNCYWCIFHFVLYSFLELLFDMGVLS